MTLNNDRSVGKDGVSLSLAGLDLRIFGLEHAQDWPSSSRVACMFMLHGRGGAKEDLYAQIQDIITDIAAAQFRLIIVSLDQRNHGTRSQSTISNLSWPENPSHALDMISIQSGSVSDVVHLMDYLPSAVFPHDEHTIGNWMIAGVSLGGHSAWIAGSQSAKFTHVIPIIGSPNITKLLRERAANQTPPIPFGPPAFPSSLLTYMGKADPVNVPLSVWKDKHIFALCGKDDKLVPVVGGGTEAFIDTLRKEGVDASLFIEEGVGHAFSWGMVSKMIDWLKSQLQVIQGSSTRSNL